MKKFINTLVLKGVLLIAALFLTGCSHHRDTREAYPAIQLASDHTLIDIWDSLNEFLSANWGYCPIANNVGGIGWDSGQRIIVYLFDYNEEQVDLFRTKILDSPYLYFELSPSPPEFLGGYP